MLKGLLKRRPDGTADREFWEWFAAHAAELRDVKDGTEPIMDELDARLKRVHEDLAFEFGPAADGRTQLAVSADGVREVFPVVERLVAAAPELPGWQVVAFRQRGNAAEATIEMNGMRIGPEDIWFQEEVDDQGVGIHLCVRHLDPERPEPVQHAVYILLDNALGEYDVTMKVQWIQWYVLPDDPREAELRPFQQLPAIVDRLTA